MQNTVKRGRPTKQKLVVEFKKRVAKRLWTPFSWSKYGVSPEYWDKFGSFVLVFLIESNIASWAR